MPSSDSNIRCKILVAEDDKFLARAYEFKLSRAGCQIIMAANGEEAINKMKAEKPDLVLLDIIMPKKNGFDILLEIKADPELKAIPVIIMSNLGQEGDIKKGLQAGAIDYIVKANTSLEEVVKLIEKYLKEHCTKCKAGDFVLKSSPSSAASLCPHCKSSVTPGAQFCPQCGKSLGS